MRNKIILTMVIFIGMSSAFFPQGHFRSGRFFHHSTGGCIWGPNSSNTSIPNEISLYNIQNAYTGNDAVSMNEMWFPNNDNEWYTWHRIFDNLDPNNNIFQYFQSNKIIVIKSCYPSSSIVGVGSPQDTLNNPSLKTIYNYKWHWRSIVQIMKQNPDNFFVIWTNAPLVPNATNSQQALLSKQFCIWAKDTLAAGLDSVFGEFPPNVYVFDFFHKLADSNGMLQLQYAASANDSHPNSTATELVAPQFVEEIFNAAIVYEGIIPVELTSFTADYNDSEVILSWSTATELNNQGFEVERTDNSKITELQYWERIGSVQGTGTSTVPVEYSFADKKITTGKYNYRLKQLDFNGNFQYSNVIEIEVNKKFNYSLEQNYPNPFNPTTSIQYAIASKQFVLLKVYDVLGNEVVTLVNENKPAGNYNVIFDASKLSSGVYFYTLRTGEFSKTNKMILTR
jgi:hypothetical protein